MLYWINVFTLLVGCGSVMLVLMSTSVFDGLKFRILSRYFLKSHQQHFTPVLISLNNSDFNNNTFASSVWCLKRLDGSKKCNFKNVFFMPQFREHIVFLFNEHSVLSGVESASALKDINLSTVKNHTNCLLKLIMFKSSEYINRQEFLVLNGKSLILKRFKPDNIMHIIHDDLLPLFLTFHELCHGNIERCVETYQLIFLDSHDEGPYFEWYELFSNFKPILLKDQNFSILMSNVVTGMSQESVWFDYGFRNNQGPIINSQFDGLFIKKFSLFIKQKFGIGNHIFKSQDLHTVVFLNRILNRKVLNGNLIEKHIIELSANIHKKNVKVLNMDLSTNGSKTLISTLHQSNMLVGMHGSAMMFSIFMPESSNIIELFPYGIQPDIVSPIKALCSLPYVYYNYYFWINTNESNSITHPEYPPLLGGITHLAPEQQKVILDIKLVPPVKCCHNPLYLFRMFQDTLVDESFFSLLDDVIGNNDTSSSSWEDSKRHQMGIFHNLYFPPPVFNLSCECVNKELTLLWSYPVNTLSVRFSVFVSNGFSSITNVTRLKITALECDPQHITAHPLSVWVKTIDGSQESLDSYKQCSYY